MLLEPRLLIIAVRAPRLATPPGLVIRFRHTVIKGIEAPEISMKKTGTIGCVILLAGLVVWLAERSSQRFLFSRVERIGEKGLPKSVVEDGDVIYCRMKADDFRFPLPMGSHALTPVITSGGFDWVDGVVVVRFDGSNHITADQYEGWVLNKIQPGGSIIASPLPGGLSIKFHYFGDK